MVDLVFERYRIAVDYEGDHHRTDPITWQKDIARVPRLQAIGWHHIRASAADKRDSRELIERVRGLLLQRGWNGRQALPRSKQ